MTWINVENYHDRAPVPFSQGSNLTLWDNDNSDGNSPFTSENP